jgi:hypothetical protein
MIGSFAKLNGNSQVPAGVLQLSWRKVALRDSGFCLFVSVKSLTIRGGLRGALRRRRHVALAGGQASIQLCRDASHELGETAPLPLRAGVGLNAFLIFLHAIVDGGHADPP